MKPNKTIGIRHLMAFLLFLAGIVVYGIRNCMAIAIVAMTDPNVANPDYPPFNWTPQQQATISSSFFWGYIFTQFPGGMMSQRFGPKWVIFSGVVLSIILSYFTPLAAFHGGWGAVCAVRVLLGLVQGCLYPAIQCSLSKWAPPEERGILSSAVFAGCQVGVILSMALSGVLANSAGGWPSIFYTFGSIAIVWCVLWVFLASNEPSEHKWISEDEKLYIATAIGNNPMKRQLKVPWGPLLRSVPMWAILVAHMCDNWGYWILLTEMPTYMSHALGFDIEENGYLSALPYLVNTILCFVFGILADQIVMKHLVQPVWSRRLFNTIGFFGPGIPLAILGYIPKERGGTAVALFTIGVGLNAGIYSGYMVNRIDLSPNFAGATMGITNGLSFIMPVVGLELVKSMVPDLSSIEQWRNFFWIPAGLYIASNVIYVLFASATLQPWDDPNYKRKNKSNETKTMIDPKV